MLWWKTEEVLVEKWNCSFIISQLPVLFVLSILVIIASILLDWTVIKYTIQFNIFSDELHALFIYNLNIISVTHNVNNLLMNHLLMSKHVIFWFWIIISTIWRENTTFKMWNLYNFKLIISLRLFSLLFFQ